MEKAYLLVNLSVDGTQNFKNKKELAPDKIGEICMIGDCVSQGYIGHNKNSKVILNLNQKKHISQEI